MSPKFKTPACVENISSFFQHFTPEGGPSEGAELSGQDLRGPSTSTPEVFWKLCVSLHFIWAFHLQAGHKMSTTAGLQNTKYFFKMIHKTKKWGKKY